MKDALMSLAVIVLSLALAAPGERKPDAPEAPAEQPAAEKPAEGPAEEPEAEAPPKADGEEPAEGKPEQFGPEHIAALLVELGSDDATRRAAAAQALGDAKAEAQWKATVALGAIGEPALPRLIDALVHEKERARWKAENALEMIGEHAVPALAEALRDQRARVRQSAAFLLGRLKDPRSLDALAAAMADKDEDVRWKAATALTKFDARATPAAVKQLASDQIEARRCAAWVFQQTCDREAVPALVKALGDPDDQVRWKAAIALQKIGAAAADPLLAILKSDAKESDKKVAAWILEGVKDVRVQTALRDIRGPDKRPTTATPTARPRPKTLPKSVAIVITSEPDKATVFIDDKYAGVTPLTVAKLRPGHHFFKLTKRDHLPETKLVELLYAEEKLNFKLALKPKGSIRVSSEPSEADVYIDGEYEGKTPLEKADVDANPYSVRVEKEHYVPWETEIEVRAGQQVKVAAALKSKVEGWYLARLKDNANDVSCHTELAHYYMVRGQLDPAAKAIAKAIDVVGNGADTSGYAGRLAQEIQKIWGQSFQFGGGLELDAVRKALHAAMHNCYKSHKNKAAVQAFLRQLRKGTSTDFTQPPR